MDPGGSGFDPGGSGLDPGSSRMDSGWLLQFLCPPWTFLDTTLLTPLKLGNSSELKLHLA